MSKIKTELSPQQARLIQLLLAGKSQNEAAAELGVSPRTITRWMELPQFTQEYKHIKTDLASQVIGEINKLFPKAIKALEDSLTCNKAPMVKLQAASMVLERIAPTQVGKGVLAHVEEQQGQILDPALMSYMTDGEIGLIEDIIKKAEERKREAESKVTPIRREA